jgi:hypothetical protein
MSRRITEQHRAHSKADCIHLLRQISAFLDEELPDDSCVVIQKHMGVCAPCEVFASSLRQTVTLCRHTGYHQLSPGAKARLHAEILKAVGRA